MTLSWTHVMLMVLTSAIVTPAFVFLIPHARQSTGFTRLLLVATFVIAFLGSWMGIAEFNDLMPTVAFERIPLAPIILGALGGAILLNLILFVLDLLEHPAHEDGDSGDSGLGVDDHGTLGSNGNLPIDAPSQIDELPDPSPVTEEERKE